MEPTQYLKAIKGRWLILVLAVVVGLAGAWLTRDIGASSPRQQPRGAYTASAVLLSANATREAGYGSLDTLSELTRLRSLLTRVAKRIGFTEDPEKLRNRIEVTPDSRTGFLTFTSSAPTAAEAEEVANAFARTIVNFVAEKQVDDLAKETEALQRDLDAATEEVDGLNEELRAASEERARNLRPLLDQALRERETIEAQLQQLSSAVDQFAKIEVVDKAVAHPTSSAGPPIPSGTPIRLGIGAAAGLILGLLLALLLEKVNSRIRNSDAAERHFQVPVLARIPRIPRRQRRSAPVAVISAPSSLAADAFRVLAASIMRWPPLATELAATHASIDEWSKTDAPAGDRWGNPSAHTATRTSEGSLSVYDQPRPERAILITSAAGGEGKSTVVANLAGAFSEMGKKTIVLSCDLRKPEVHKLLEVAGEPGLVDGLNAETGSVLNGRLVESPLGGASRIHVVPSGRPPQNPAELLNSDQMREAIDEACRSADVVLIDTPPILAAMDVALMVSEVDAVLVVAKSGKTSTKVADGTSEMLNTLGAPFLGVVLNCSADIVRPKSYRGFPPLSRHKSYS